MGRRSFRRIVRTISLQEASTSIMKRAFVVQGVFGIALALCGCGGGGPAGPPLKKVTGTVQLNGSPLGEATVAFIPQAGVTSGIGTSDGTGKFVLLSSTGREGVAVGKYRVTVTKSTVKAPVPEASSFEEMEMEHKAGKKRQVLTSRHLSEVFETEMQVRHRGGRVTAFLRARSNGTL